MDEEIMNATEPEVVQPEAADVADNGAETGAVAKPRDIESMSDDEFAEYLKQVQSGTLSQLGQEDSAEEAEDTGDTDPQDTEAEDEKPYRVYKTHEEFQQDFDRIMGERLKNNRKSLELLDKLKIEARNFYGDAADDTAAINALLGDLANQNADKRGVDESEYKRQTQDAEDARRYRAEHEAQNTRQKEIDAIKERWERDSEDLRRAVPSFDFRKAMENKAFNDAILSGASVQTAYMIANQSKTKPKRQPVRQVAMQSGVSGKTDYDPSKLPSGDFNAYIDRIMNR